MGVLTRMFEQRFNWSEDPPDWYIKAMGWQTDTEISVNTKTALQVSAVFACVRILSDTIGSLPLLLYRRRSDGGKERAAGHPLYSLLHDLPNPEMTSIELRETLMGHLGTWGNSYAEIDRNPNSGRLSGLWPLRPDKMRVERLDGELVYFYTLPEKVGSSEVPLQHDRVMHIRGLGFNGMIGYSPIGMARQAIWLAMATEQFGTRFFQNDARPGIVLQHPQQLSEKAQKNLRESWEEYHGGLSKSHRMAILEEGMQLKEVGIPPEDAQFLQTRKFQVTEIARMYRIPPHMLADLERATFSNIEHQSIEFVVHTVRPWLVRWEQAIRRDFLTPTERRQYFAEFLVDGLLRGDIQSRYQAYATARQNGWLSANDVRALENMNPIDGGDVYLIPLNMIPAGSAGEMRSGRELRALRSATARRRLSEAHNRIFVDTAARILRREMNDVLNNARKIFKKRDMHAFRTWLDEFYQDHHEFIQRHMLPVFTAYAELVAAEAGDEIGETGEMTPELEQFIRSYVKSYADRHVGSSIGQIKSVAGEAVNAREEPVEALEVRFADWEEKRPKKIAMWETIQSNNAIAVEVFAAGGFLKVRWRAFGESCPYCRRLNGRVVGIRENFLAEGVAFNPEGADRPLVPSVNIRHPPAHGGCDCMVTASV